MPQLTDLFQVSASARIIEYMIMEIAEDPDVIIDPRTIVKGAHINIRTVRTSMPLLIEYGIVIEGEKTRKYGGRPIKTYTLNMESDIVKSLIIVQVRLTRIEEKK